jgi:hypothetical protein
MAERSGFVRGLGTLAIVAAGLAAGGAITAYMPNTDEQQRPFIHTGSDGDVVDARAFDAQLLGVRGGTRLAGGGAAHDTAGVWILVEVRLMAKGEATYVGNVDLRDGDGKTYRATGRVNQPIGGGRDLQPGVPIHMEIAFEVPKDVALPLAIQLSPALFDPRMDGMAQLDLGIGAADIGIYLTGTDTLSLRQPSMDGEPSATPSTTGGPA